MSTEINSARRVAVITGASSGIGEATARALAADGTIAITADVTDRDSLVAALNEILVRPTAQAL